MALSINFKSKPVVMVWYINNEHVLTPSEIDDILYIAMDGDELDHVKIMYHDGYGEHPRIIPRGRLVQVYGDLAKTIVANLNNMK